MSQSLLASKTDPSRIRKIAEKQRKLGATSSETTSQGLHFKVPSAPAARPGTGYRSGGLFKATEPPCLRSRTEVLPHGDHATSRRGGAARTPKRKGIQTDRDPRGRVCAGRAAAALEFPWELSRHRGDLRGVRPAGPQRLPRCCSAAGTPKGPKDGSALGSNAGQVTQPPVSECSRENTVSSQREGKQVEHLPCPVGGTGR